MDRIDEKIDAVAARIEHAFTGVQLGTGVSWREADVLDSYGSARERTAARELDEKEDWRRIPHSLIGALKYQSVLPFLNAGGFKFYLAPCMIFALKNYRTSNSLISDSILYSLTSASTAKELQAILDPEQKQCVIDFLSLCLEIGDDHFDLHKVEDRLQKYWIESTGGD